jgi:uncharacterized membrane protein
MQPWVAFTLVGALLFALGNALQKRGLAGRLPEWGVGSLAARPLRLLRAFTSSRAWLLGSGITLLALAAETQALGLGEASAVKPLSQIQSLFVIAIGVALLGERLSRREWLGAALLLSGAWVLALEAADAIPASPSRSDNVAFGLGVAALIAFSAALADRHGPRAVGEWSPALAAGALFGLGDVMMKAGTESVRTRIGHFDLSRADAFGSLAAAPEFHLALALGAAAFLLQQLAFSRGRVSLSAPLVSVSATAMVVLLGAAFLGESLGVGRSLGVGLTLLGTLLLAWPEQHGRRLAAA